MDVNRIISELDAEISHLQQIRSQLAGYGGAAQAASTASAAKKGTGRRGRPKGSKNTPKGAAVKASATKTAPAKKARRTLSPEARKRIADAQKRRWAERRKA